MYITIDRNSGISIIRQVYNQIRNKILSGELPPKKRLPSSRELSSFLQVSRNVINEAYELLELEGFIYTKPQSGTYVAESAIFSSVMTKQNSDTTANDTSLSSCIDLRSGMPALDNLPLKKWGAYHNDVLLNSLSPTFGYGTAKGNLQLRKAICNYLFRMRGVSCNPEHIIITSGSLHSFSILSQILCQNNNSYIIEDPLHFEIKKVLENTSTNCNYVSVDTFGMQTSLLPTHLNPAFIFVTPSHQYPLGGILPIQRRIELIEYARSKNCYIVEDDYDSEYRYSGAPVSTLYSLDCNRVIYVGTFSKVLFPSVRIGYMVLPPVLLEETADFVRYHDYFFDNINQLALVQMLNNFDIDHHISKMKKLYKNRRDYMIKALTNTFGDKISISGAETGLHLVVNFNDINFTDDIIKICKANNLLIYPVWHHSQNKKHPKNSLIMGYSHLEQSLIDKAVSVIYSVLYSAKLR